MIRSFLRSGFSKGEGARYVEIAREKRQMNSDREV